MMNAPFRLTRDTAPPCAQWMGMDLIEHRKDEHYTKVMFTPNKDMINFGGVVQDRFLIAMMDDAMGFNAFISLGMKFSMASTDLHTYFLKAVALGPITVDALVTRAGKSVIFLAAILYNETGELAARATSSSKLRAFIGLQFDTKDKIDG